jgi:hypothetical protein
MIIIIDDEFKLRFGEVAPPGTLHAATPDDAIALIRAQWNNITALFLDRDLGQDAHGEEIDIIPVVKWLEDRANQKHILACPGYVHSMNSTVGPLVQGLVNRGYNARRIPLDTARSTLKGIAI